MSEIKQKPILFSAPMVRAILDGRKTVTRRPVKGGQIPTENHELESGQRWSAIAQRHPRWGFCVFGENEAECAGKMATFCPYGRPGERLWVRETWYCDRDEVMHGPYLKPDDLDIGEAHEDGTLVYAADGLTPYEAEQPTWKPSIHMPRWACRILLEITEVRVERLQDISEDQAKAEGVGIEAIESFRDTGVDRPAGFAFRDLWASTGGDWDANPWVWVIEFKRVTP